MRLKHLLGKNPASKFNGETLFKLFAFLKEQGLDCRLAWNMAPALVDDATMPMEQVLNKIGFKRFAKDDLLTKLDNLCAGFAPKKKSCTDLDRQNWIMGQMREATGNIEMKELANNIK
jgi:hypothetical protein